MQSSGGTAKEHSFDTVDRAGKPMPMSASGSCDCRDMQIMPGIIRDRAWEKSSNPHVAMWQAAVESFSVGNSCRMRTLGGVK